MTHDLKTSCLNNAMTDDHLSSCTTEKQEQTTTDLPRCAADEQDFSAVTTSACATEEQKSDKADVASLEREDAACCDSEVDSQLSVNPKAVSKKTTIGGQALIEGLIMLGPKKQAIAVRDKTGEIKVTVKDRDKRFSTFNVPLLRGVVRLVTQLKTGIQALMYSADVSMTEEEKQQESENEGWFDRFANRHPDLMLTLTLMVSLGLSIALFILLPSGVTDLIRRLTGFGLGEQRGPRVFILSLIEGVVRIGIFLLYMYLTSKASDIRRVWMYHGAEHKTIACYEAGLPLTVENVKKNSRFHPRCGTSFIFIVMLISILVFALIGRYTVWINVLLRLALLPVVAGIAYEVQRVTGSCDNALTRVLVKPGLALQRLTTAEPDDEMIEVAIAAMSPVIPENPQDDLW
jgi:uncharacterized protein YqhQ